MRVFISQRGGLMLICHSEGLLLRTGWKCFAYLPGAASGGVSALFPSWLFSQGGAVVKRDAFHPPRDPA